MEVRSLGFRTDLMVRRMAGSVVEDAGDYLIVRTPNHPSYYWGNFLLLSAPPDGNDVGMWLDRFEEAFPLATHVALGIDGTDVDLGPPGRWAAAGLVGESSSVLTAERLAAPVREPDGFALRALRSDLDWRRSVELRVDVAVSEGSASTAHRIFLETSVAEARHLSEAGHATYFGAFAEDRLCSYLGLVVDRGGTARFQTVETHPAYRRRGLASALVYRAGIHGLDEEGATVLVIVADPDGPAISLYRSIGFTEVERQAQLEHVPPN